MLRSAPWTLALLLLGCDPATAPADAPAKPANKPAPAVVEPQSNVSGDRAGLAGCLDTCKQGKMSATDQETCRLNCSQSFKVADNMDAASKVRETQLDGHIACTERCVSGAEPARAPCLAACKDASPELGAVADSLSGCVSECLAAPGTSATDRGTCKLNCRAAAGTTLAAPPAP